MPERTEQWRSTIASLWEKQGQWSKAADIYKTSHRSWNGPLILVGFLGVVFATVSPYVVSLMTTHWSVLRVVLTVIGPLLVSAAALLTREVLGPKQEQKWIKAREVAEKLKAEGYIYAVGAPPYVNLPNAPSLLAAKISEVTAANLGEPLPPSKPQDGKPHDALSLEDYIARRADDQRAFHERDARTYAKVLATWRALAIALMIVSGALGIIAGIADEVAVNVWIAVVSTALATLTAYVYATRLEFLTATYAATAEQLESLVRTWKAKSAPAPGERDRFVLDCEAVLAAQNRTWSDELSKRVGERLKAGTTPPQMPIPADKPSI